MTKILVATKEQQWVAKFRQSLLYMQHFPRNADYGEAGWFPFVIRLLFRNQGSDRTSFYGIGSVNLEASIVIFVRIQEYSEQDRRYTYNVTLRRVRVTSVTVRKKSVLNIMRMCLCSLLVLVFRHANFIFSASYCIVVCGLSGSTEFFPHYHINGTTFEKK